MTLFLYLARYYRMVWREIWPAYLRGLAMFAFLGFLMQPSDGNFNWERWLFGTLTIGLLLAFLACLINAPFTRRVPK